MENKSYLSVGTWNFRAPDHKGIHLIEWDSKKGVCGRKHSYDETVSAGMQCYNPETQMLYFVDECECHPGFVGGGGYVRSYRLDEKSGELSFVNEKCVFMSKPCYVTLDESGRYLLVAAHSGRAFVTKVRKSSTGRYFSEVEYDDSGIAVFRLFSDGSIGEISDIVRIEGETENRAQIHAHPHSIVGKPGSDLYYVCDKGIDKIIAFRLNREKGKLVQLMERQMDYASAPRYSAFHPSLKVLYENNETSNYIFAFGYDESTGNLTEISRRKLLEADEYSGKVGSASDLVVHPNGRYLYVAVREVDQILIFTLNEENGVLQEKRMVSSPGGPRGLVVSRDGRFLLSANNQTGMILKYNIEDDGGLNFEQAAASVENAANIRILYV